MYTLIKKVEEFLQLIKKEDLVNKIIPFFELNELQSTKQYSFLRFKKALYIFINNKPLLPNHF